MSQRRALRRELNKVVKKAFPDPDLRRKVMACYHDPLLDKLLKQAELKMGAEGVENADRSQLDMSDVQPLHRDDATG